VQKEKKKNGGVPKISEISKQRKDKTIKHSEILVAPSPNLIIRVVV
jgi:hypothetical protein